MKTVMHSIATVLLGMTAVPLHAQELRFISCPVYRDTDAGKKSGCWLTDDRQAGIRYDISAAPTKPDWNYQILVEGKVAATQDEHACGGVTLNPVRVSVLEGACPRHMLPAEEYKGRVFVLPRRNVDPASVPRMRPTPPYQSTTFNLYFDFNSSFFVYQYDDYLLDQAITWLRAARPRRITVVGYADTQMQRVSGQPIAERAEIGQQRAQTITTALTRLGIDKALIRTVWSTRPDTVPTEDSDWLTWPSRRRVEIRAEF